MNSLDYYIYFHWLMMTQKIKKLLEFYRLWRKWCLKYEEIFREGIKI